MNTLDDFRDDRKVDTFVSRMLFERGLFNSDGMPWSRVLHEDAAALTIVGRLVEVTQQTHHLFWLELRQSAEGVTWTLRFDVVASVFLGKPENVAYLLEKVDDATWAHCLSGLWPASAGANS